MSLGLPKIVNFLHLCPDLTLMLSLPFGDRETVGLANNLGNISDEYANTKTHY